MNLDNLRVAPIRLTVYKKFETVSKSGYSTREDWKLMLVINYNDSINYFHKIAGIGKFKTDAEFCRYLRDLFGVGKFMITVNKKKQGHFKGMSGFRLFMRVDLKPYSFLRYRKRKSRNQRDVEESRAKLYTVKQQLKFEEDPERRAELNNELSNYQDDYETDVEFRDMERQKQFNTGAYLDCIKPVFSEHTYDEEYHDDSSKSSSKKSNVSTENYINDDGFDTLW